MKRLQLWITVLVALFFIAISFVVMPSPQLNEMRAAFGLGTCGQVCWHGIQVGKTTIAEAVQILSADPNITMLGAHEEGCPVTWRMTVAGVDWQGHICGWLYVTTEPVQWIRLEPTAGHDPAFTLLDSIAVFGQPADANCASWLGRDIAIYRATFVFKSNTQVSAQHDLPYDGLLFDPLMPITSIHYEVGEVQSEDNTWHGFTSEHFTGQTGSGPCPMAVE